MGVRSRPPIVEFKDDKGITYINTETGFDSLRIVKGVDHLIYISDTDMENGHRSFTIKYTICLYIDIQIPINLVDLEVQL